ncbi:MAG: outer membrane beta-barrel protein [Chryseobacterium sp.]
MKKVLLAGAIALFGLSNAQIAKGTTYVSGQVGYSSTQDNNTDSKVEDFTIVPTVGYFVGNNLAVGLGVGYANSSTTTTSALTNVETKLSTDAFVVAPFVRKYWTVGEKFYIFGQLEVPMAFGKDKAEYSGTASQFNTESKFTSIGVNVKPGLDYFLNKNWSIEATIGEFGYNNFKYKDLDKSTDNFNFGLNLSSVTFGVKYVFAK